MDKQGIIDYVMETPENINPVILGQFLDEISGEDEGEGEVWATYTQEGDTDENNGLYLNCYNEQVTCESGTATIKTSTELMNCFTQADGTYKIKAKGYFLDFPNVEVDVVYQGSLVGWKCDYEEKYGDNYEWSCSSDISVDIENAEARLQIIFRYNDNPNSTTIYPTKIELIVYKK